MPQIFWAQVVLVPYNTHSCQLGGWHFLKSQTMALTQTQLCWSWRNMWGWHDNIPPVIYQWELKKGNEILLKSAPFRLGKETEEKLFNTENRKAPVGFSSDGRHAGTKLHFVGLLWKISKGATHVDESPQTTTAPKRLLEASSFERSMLIASCQCRGGRGMKCQDPLIWNLPGRTLWLTITGCDIMTSMRS